MAKTKTARAGKPQKTKTKKTTKPKSPASAKPTAEQLSDMDRQRLTLHHTRRVKPLIEAVKEAQSDLREAIELAKGEGVSKKMIELAILMQTEEGRTKVLGQMQTILDVDRWTGKAIGTQLDMFDKQSPKEAAFEQGRIAALNNEPRRPPSHLAEAAARSWMEGWGSGMSQVNKARESSLDGFRKLGEVIPGSADQGEAVDDLAAEQEAA